MKRMMNVLLIVWAVVLCIPAISLQAMADLVEGDLEEAADLFADTVASGTCGQGLTWTVDADGVLTISGTGWMSNYYDYDDFRAPWCSESITSLIIKNGVRSIGENAFYGCSSLTGSLVIPNSVTYISESAFAGCSGFTGSLEIPDSVTSIGHGAFAGCSGFTGRLKISAGVDRICDNTFSGCSGLTGDLVIPTGVTRIGDLSFWNCSGFTGRLVIPKTVESIGSGAFLNCSGLTGDLVIPYGVESIEPTTFEGCSGFTGYLDIPGTVTNIGNFAFSRCSGLTGGLGIPGGVTSIGNFAFSFCSGLTGDLWIPEGISDIAHYAFCGCSGLTGDLVIPYGVESIGYGAFRDCSGFSGSLVIPDGVTRIESWAFEGCSGFATNFVIPSSVMSINDYAFYGCNNLPGITISKETTDIGWDAFGNCTNLTDVFYDGTKEDWDLLPVEYTGLDHVNLFFVNNLEKNFSVSITTENVPGGVRVELTSEGGEIYYTIDGSTPSSNSIPYEGPFLLDKAGVYIVYAIAFDLENGTYSDVSYPEYIYLNQSAQPEVRAEGRTVTILPSGDVYYTFDLTKTPTTEDQRYSGPLVMNGTTVIRARTIESGHAASETVTYAYYGGNGSVISYPEDSYSFENVRESFGYSGFVYKIPKIRYIEIFGDTVGQMLYDEYGSSSWRGSCFGMCATSLLFQRGMLSLANYSNTAKTVYELPAPRSKSSELTELIERYQISQFLPNVMMERSDVLDGGNLVISDLGGNSTEGDRLIKAVEQCCDGSGDPLILIIWRQELSGCHAVVPYRIEDGKIYIYDCEKPGAENYISYYKTNGNYRFSYGVYSYAVSCNYLSTLLTELENLQSDKAVLSSERGEMMLISMNTKKYSIRDEDGNIVFDCLRFRPTEDSDTGNTLLYLRAGKYTVENYDSSIETLKVSVATDRDYYSVAVSNPSARIEIGGNKARLNICITSSGNTEVQVYTNNDAGRENRLTVVSDHVEISAYHEKAIHVTANAETITANGASLMMLQGPTMPQDPDQTNFYSAPVTQRLNYSALKSSNNFIYTNMTELPTTAFTLPVEATVTEEGCTLYAAAYDEKGKMTKAMSRETAVGTGAYTFEFDAGAAQVKVFLLNADSQPMKGALIISRK